MRDVTKCVWLKKSESVNRIKRRRYTLRFMKSYQWVDWGSWKEVSDTFVLYVLSELQDKYDFEIVSVKLKDCFSWSKIVIRCAREDKSKIFFDFSTRLSGHIEKISM